MKKLKNIIVIMAFFGNATAQIPFANLNSETLDINNVSCSFSATGDLGAFNGIFGNFTVPKTSGKSPVYAGNIWVGGVDAGGQLKMSAQTYRQNGSDFFNGPYMNSGSYSAALDNQWNKVWKIDKATIDSFKLGLFGSIIPLSISSWPGNGNTALGQASVLAPYVDINGDGNYDAVDGDYPCIRGDQAVYFIFNDDRGAHTQSGGQSLGIEVRGMAYAFNSSTISVSNSIFINYQIINRSFNTLHDAYITSWTDFDLGNFADDYSATDVKRNAYYVYNGDQDDEGNSGYGLHPPAEAVVFLKGPIADNNDGIDNNMNCITDETGEHIGLFSARCYNSFWGVQQIGDPVIPIDYYNYMMGKWKDSTMMEYYGNAWSPSGTTNGVQSRYMFPGDSDSLYGWGQGGNCTTSNIQPNWTEAISSNVPYDRKMFGSTGPFTFAPGETKTLDLAYVYGRDSTAYQSVLAMKSAIDNVQNFFDNLMQPVCSIAAGIKEKSTTQPLTIFPNPTNSILNIQLQGLKINLIEIFDITGELVRSISNNEINVADLSSGLYLIKANDGKMAYTGKFVKE